MVAGDDRARSAGSTSSTTTRPCRCPGRLVDTTEDDWDLTIATNLDAVFWACRAALPHLIDAGDASIISTASVLGLIGSEGYAAYGPAKAGLVALMRQIATEYGPKVRANVIAPGSIDTPRFRKVAETMPDRTSSRTSSRRSRCTGSAPPTTSPASRCSSRRTSRRTRRAPSSPPTAGWRRSDDLDRAARSRSSRAAASGLGAADRRPGSRPRAQRSSSPTSTRTTPAGSRSRSPTGGDAEPTVVDVTHEGEVAAMFEAISEQHGRLDVLVCSAAVETRASIRRDDGRGLAPGPRRQPQGSVPLHEAGARH